MKFKITHFVLIIGVLFTTPSCILLLVKSVHSSTSKKAQNALAVDQGNVPQDFIGEEQTLIIM